MKKIFAQNHCPEPAGAAGGGTQDANCAAPERMSPTYCRHNVYHTDSKILYRLKRFLGTKRKI